MRRGRRGRRGRGRPGGRGRPPRCGGSPPGGGRRWPGGRGGPPRRIGNGRSGLPIACRGRAVGRMSARIIRTVGMVHVHPRPAVAGAGVSRQVPVPCADVVPGSEPVLVPVQVPVLDRDTVPVRRVPAPSDATAVDPAGLRRADPGAAGPPQVADGLPSRAGDLARARLQVGLDALQLLPVVPVLLPVPCRHRPARLPRCLGGMGPARLGSPQGSRDEQPHQHQPAHRSGACPAGTGRSRTYLRIRAISTYPWNRAPRPR